MGERKRGHTEVKNRENGKKGDKGCGREREGKRNKNEIMMERKRGEERQKVRNRGRKEKKTEGLRR